LLITAYTFFQIGRRITLTESQFVRIINRLGFKVLVKGYLTRFQDFVFVLDTTDGRNVYLYFKEDVVSWYHSPRIDDNHHEIIRCSVYDFISYFICEFDIDPDTIYKELICR
jgi:hypothetical protein